MQAEAFRLLQVLLSLDGGNVDVQDVCRMARLSKTRVINYLHSLEREGFIIITER